MSSGPQNEAGGGFGLVFADIHGEFVVSGVTRGGPASKGGVGIGDVVHSVDGHELRGVSFEEATRLCREAGATLSLGVRPLGSSRVENIRITRDPLLAAARPPSNGSAVISYLQDRADRKEAAAAAAAAAAEAIQASSAMSQQPARAQPSPPPQGAQPPVPATRAVASDGDFDLQHVMSHTGVSRDDALRALNGSNRDVVEAIEMLSAKPFVHPSMTPDSTPGLEPRSNPPPPAPRGTASPSGLHASSFSPAAPDAQQMHNGSMPVVGKSVSGSASAELEAVIRANQENVKHFKRFMNDKMARLKADLSEKEKDITSLQRQLGNKDGELHNLQQLLEKTRQELENARAAPPPSHSPAEAEVSEVHEAAKLRQAVRTLKHSFGLQLKDKTAEIEKKDKYIDELKARLAEKESALPEVPPSEEPRLRMDFFSPNTGNVTTPAKPGEEHLFAL